MKKLQIPYPFLSTKASPAISSGFTMLVLGLAFFAVSCEESVEWQVNLSTDPLLVVDAMLANEPSLNYVRLSYSLDSIGASPLAVSNADVYFTSGTDSVELQETEAGSGLYKPITDVRGVINRKYRLGIRLNDRYIYADAGMVPVSPAPRFNYYPDGRDSTRYFIVDPGSSSPAITEYSVEWTDSSGMGQQSLIRFYQLSTVDVPQFFKPAAAQQSYPANSIINMKKYSLTPEHERFIRSILLETEWRGGWFDIIPGNTYTNLKGGAVGFFAVCSVTEETFQFE